MIKLNIHSDTPIAYYDESLKTYLMLTSEWEVEADSDDEHSKSTLPLYVSNELSDLLREYQRTVSFGELSGKYEEIGFTVSEKLTEKLRFPCRARLTALTPDERSAKLLELETQRKRLSDPAVMAAEMEKAMQKARETAEKNGMNIQDIMNQPLPEMPVLPDDPLERAKALSEHYEKLKQTANIPAKPDLSSMSPEEQRKAIVGGMISDDRSYKPDEPKPAMMGMGIPGNNMRQYRPKFCMSCGAKLPPSGNFCGNCGKSIF